MFTIPSTIEEYANQCEQVRARESGLVRGCLMTIRQHWRVSHMPTEDKGHLVRAALRSFGPKYELIDFDRVRCEGREYHYNFRTGRFYGVNN